MSPPVAAAAAARCCSSVPAPLLARPTTCPPRHARSMRTAPRASASAAADASFDASSRQKATPGKRMLATAQKRLPAARATSNNDEATTTTSIVPDRARYHVFEMDGVDFLIGTGDDGRLDVRDAFICDSSSAKNGGASHYGDDEDGAPAPSYSRAEGHDSPDLPQQPLPFVAVPWEVRFDGDTLYKKPAWSKLLKVYLIAAARTEPSVRLDLTQVVSLDAATRSVRREEVVNRATSEDPEHTTLRIRANGIMLVDAADLPSPDDIIDGRDTSFPKVVKEEKKRRKPFWFEGTYRTDEAGNEVERIRDGRWEEDFDEGGEAKKNKKKGGGKGGEEGDSDDEEEEAEKPAWLIPEEETGGGREGWE